MAEASREAGYWISGDGRIGERDAAQLLGWSHDSLRNARKKSTGPRFYRLGGGGHQITYRLTDLAVWIESRKEVPRSNRK